MSNTTKIARCAEESMQKRIQRNDISEIDL